MANGTRKIYCGTRLASHGAQKKFIFYDVFVNNRKPCALCHFLNLPETLVAKLACLNNVEAKKK